MTCTLMTWPIRPADSAPASTAALTAATSPLTKAVTRPLPALSQPTISTLAAFSMASLPSIRATRPLHSSRPRASLGINSSFICESLHQFHIRRRINIARVSFIRIDVHFQHHLGVISHLHSIEAHPARPFDVQLHVVPIL